MRSVSWLGFWAILAAITSPGRTAEGPGLFSGRCELADAAMQRDFPDMSLDAAGTPWVTYVEHDGKADVLRLAKTTEKGLESVAQLAGPGVIHQPAIACDGAGALWCFWGELGPKQVVNLHARRWAAGRLSESIVLAESDGSDTFADAGTDHAGRVWVVWQSLRRGQGDVYARWYDPRLGRWSAETAVSGREGGSWEPRVAFDGRDGAWVVFDSSRGNEFNLYLAHVVLDGRAEVKPLTDSPAYEGRASIAASADGKGFWITAERGRPGWGKDSRSHGAQFSLNAQKRILLGYYDIAAGTFLEMPPATAILARWAGTIELPLPANLKKAPAAKPAARAPHAVLAAVNLPQVVVDAAGNPWIACRCNLGVNWHIALMRFDAAARAWSQPAKVQDSAFCQDRHCRLVRGRQDQLWLCWPSDRRTGKACGVSGVYLTEIDPKSAPPSDPRPQQAAALPEPVPYLAPVTPERPRGDRHAWTVDGKKFGLYWGDLHRHTDVSACFSALDGCALEQFRYAYDMAKLDFLGTSDHTDIGKRYDPYEWWHNQRVADVFHAPGKFTSLYAYEREQPWPWGHRNVVFAQRGGPIVHIERKAYQESVWQALYPCGEGSVEPRRQILPEELWQILRKYGKPLTVISHTGATPMGTDWELYKQIDSSLENLVEIYQGARVSYEGLGAPQSPVGMRVGERYVAAGAFLPPDPIKDFGPYNHGVYQHALRQGHRLGVFASSDHMSQHVSFGGVYTEKFTREGIIEAMNGRRTIAATDKIYLEFTCNGHALGSIFETGERPRLKITVRGTAPVRRVTIVRNEADYRVFDHAARDFAATFTDDSPIDGENRYYIRVEQTDGNMAWSSPVWVTFKQKSARTAAGRNGSVCYLSVP